MMKRPSKLMQALQSVDARLATQNWTILELVQLMVQSLSSQDPVEACGCQDCGLLFSISIYLHGDEELTYCPACGCAVEPLGTFPDFVDDGDGLYLEQDGFRTGPYDNIEDAQDNLWDWFGAKEEYNASKKGQQESSQTCGCKEDSQEEGGQEDKKKRGHLHLIVSKGKEETKGWGRDRCLAEEDGDGQEVEGKDPGTES